MRDAGAMDKARTVMEAFDSQRLIPLLTDSDPAVDESAAYAIAAEVPSTARRAR